MDLSELLFFFFFFMVASEETGRDEWVCEVLNELQAGVPEYVRYGWLRAGMNFRSVSECMCA